VTRRLYLAALLPLSAMLLSLLRYWQQGDSNVWTKLDLHLYVTDPDLGWRQLDEGLFWLGLDSVLLLLLTTLLVLVGARLLVERSTRLQAGLWIGAALPLALPLWAFLSGAPVQGAHATRPLQEASTEMQGVQAHLPDLPAGRYEILEHKNTGIVAQLSAGGETFDARWIRIDGGLKMTPEDLSSAIEARFTTNSGSVDSDLGERDKHIREYLQSDRHPEFSLTLEELLATREQEAGLRFQARARLQLMGAALPVEVSGQLSQPDAEARARLGVKAENLLLLKASFPLELASTPIEEPEELFDSLQANIHVTLLLHHEPAPPP
jgi:hypothetical protein